jgi:hypothetical protein
VEVEIEEGYGRERGVEVELREGVWGCGSGDGRGGESVWRRSDSEEEGRGRGGSGDGRGGRGGCGRRRSSERRGVEKKGLEGGRVSQEEGMVMRVEGEGVWMELIAACKLDSQPIVSSQQIMCVQILSLVTQ